MVMMMMMKMMMMEVEVWILHKTSLSEIWLVAVAFKNRAPAPSKKAALIEK